MYVNVVKKSILCASDVSMYNCDKSQKYTFLEKDRRAQWRPECLMSDFKINEEIFKCL